MPTDSNGDKNHLTSEKQSGANDKIGAPSTQTPSPAWKVTGYHLVILLGSVLLTFILEWKFGIDWKERIKQGYALLFGGLGGTFAASRYVVLSVRHNTYDPRRVLWQILTPLYTAVLGWVGVIALAGGILILAQSPNPAEPQFTFFIMGFAFLVGFASESFSKRLIMAAQTLFGEHSGLEEVGSPKNDGNGAPELDAKGKAEQR